MLLSSIIPILLLLFVSNVRAKGQPPRAPPKQLPMSMDELKSQLHGTDLIHQLGSSDFKKLWEHRRAHPQDNVEPIIGKMGFPSYRYVGEYEGHKAIIKGIWTTMQPEMEVVHEGFYLRDTKRLLRLAINEGPSEDNVLPNVIFIIQNDDPEYFPQKEASLPNYIKANYVRTYARSKIRSDYTPELACLTQNSFGFRDFGNGKWKAIFV
ncbi:hypothetical protein F5887DRAFT_501371 [Amanita rubescens]|nr:hypothetical protein F5887DRAFT_501371 [Amanita rubescens]